MNPEKQFTIIETERLILRRFKAADTAVFWRYRTLPDVALYQSEGWLTMTLEAAAEFVAEQSNAHPGEPDTWFQIAVELKDTGALIGDLGLHTLSDIRQAEIGFTIAPMYQHNGYALEAVLALFGYLFNMRSLHRVIAIADVRNAASINLLEKLGMRREGLFLEGTWDKGMYTDEYQYAILHAEYMKSSTKR